MKVRWPESAGCSQCCGEWAAPAQWGRTTEKSPVTHGCFPLSPVCTVLHPSPSIPFISSFPPSPPLPSVSLVLPCLALSFPLSLPPFSGPPLFFVPAPTQVPSGQQRHPDLAPSWPCPWLGLLSGPLRGTEPETVSCEQQRPCQTTVSPPGFIACRPHRASLNQARAGGDGADDSLEGHGHGRSVAQLTHPRQGKTVANQSRPSRLGCSWWARLVGGLTGGPGRA